MGLKRDFQISDPSVIEINNPIMLFKDNITHSNPQRALQDNGPWDLTGSLRNFNSLRFEILYQNGISDQEINDVIRYIEGKNNKWGDFNKVFQIRAISFASRPDWIEISSEADFTPSLASIRSRTDLSQNDPAIIVLFISREHRYDRTTPLYDRFRQIYTNAGYTTQTVSLKRLTTDTTIFSQKSTTDKLYMARNIQMQVYAKSGGIPWVISPSSSEASLIVGLGFSKIYSDTETKFAVGAMSFFEVNGIWRKLNISEKWDYNSIPRQSTGLYAPYDVIQSMLEELSAMPNFEEGSKFVIQKNNYYAKDEIAGIMDFCEERSYEVSLVQIVESNYTLFDKVLSSYNPPSSGYCLQMCEGEALLVNSDANSTRFIGTPAVLKVEQHNSSNFNQEISQIIQQIRDLTFVSWRDLYLQKYKLPATLSYARKAAQAYAKGVNPHSRLLDKPWFL